MSFDLTNGWGRSSTAHTFSQDGPALTVRAWKCSWTCKPFSAQHQSVGFGIQSGYGDNHQIDGANVREILSLASGGAVTITSLSFDYEDREDDVTILRVDNHRLVHDASAPLTLLSKELGSFTVVDGMEGTLFGVGALDWNDAFKLRGVTVSFDGPSPEVPPVPLPAAGWLLMAAVGGLAAAARRRVAAPDGRKGRPEGRPCIPVIPANGRVRSGGPARRSG